MNPIVQYLNDQWIRFMMFGKISKSTSRFDRYYRKVFKWLFINKRCLQKALEKCS